MSVSARSTKPQMYSEIERLRLELDRATRSNVALTAENGELRAQLQSRARATAARSEPASDRCTRHEVMKRLAGLCKASVKWVDGQGYKQYVEGRWLGVPTHLVEYASQNLEAHA